MLENQIGWRFSPPDFEEAEPPISEARSVVDLLITHQVAHATIIAKEISNEADSVSFAYLVSLRRIMSEVFGSREVGRMVGPPRSERTSEMEEAMANSVRFKEVDDLVEGNLNRLLANPALSEEAFPDPELRSKIIPLFRDMRKRAEEAENANKQD